MVVGRRSMWKWFFGVAGAVCLGLVWIYVVALGAGFKTYRNVSDSMAPTVSSGEVLLADLHAYRRKQLERGDVIVIQHGESVLIKRVIGLPGDKVAIKDELAAVNGRALDEPYAEHTGELAGFDTTAPVTVPGDELYLMGDNRDHSLDSRMDEFGHVHLGDVLGQVTYVLVASGGRGTRRVQ